LEKGGLEIHWAKRASGRSADEKAGRVPEKVSGTFLPQEDSWSQTEITREGRRGEPQRKLSSEIRNKWNLHLTKRRGPLTKTLLVQQQGDHSATETEGQSNLLRAPAREVKGVCRPCGRGERNPAAGGVKSGTARKGALRRKSSNKGHFRRKTGIVLR